MVLEKFKNEDDKCLKREFMCKNIIKYIKIHTYSPSQEIFNKGVTGRHTLKEKRFHQERTLRNQVLLPTNCTSNLKINNGEI